MQRIIVAAAIAASLASAGCALPFRDSSAASPPPVEDHASEKAHVVAKAAMAQVGVTKRYDPEYVEIPYPGGDVPKDRGVCTDVVVRAFRAAGVDLQAEVHEDMSAAFSAYPKRWGLTHPDPNIDHRRVPNLQKYFERKGRSLAVTRKAADYQPGDVVTWEIGGKPHTGIVSAQRTDDGSRFLITHHFGAAARTEDFLFRFPVSGHYRYF